MSAHRIRRERRPAPPPRDAGVTLVEMLVAMSLMGVFLVLFTSGVLQMYGATNRTEALAQSQSQLHLAFQRLDKEIRYASAVSRPSADGHYVEFLTTSNGTQTCTQLRLDTASGQLQRRTWTQGVSPVAPTAWLPLASGVQAVPGAAPGQPAQPPFSLTVAGGTFDFDRLRLHVQATAGRGNSGSATETDVTFTALNTRIQVQSAVPTAVCAEAGRTT